MKESNENRASKQREIRTYELLGVAHFKNVLLWLEKVKHRKSGNRNSNYHISKLTISSMKSFEGYLKYNAFLHVVSIVFVLVYFTIPLGAGYSKWWFTLIALVVLVVDIYCILLQRYLHLKIDLVLHRRLTRDERKRKGLVQQLQSRLRQFSKEEMHRDIVFLNRLLNCTSTGESYIITEADADSLNRMNQIMQNVEHHCDTDERMQNLRNTAPKWVRESNVHNTIDYRVSKLQNLLKVKRDENVLFGFCVITESAKIESQFVSIFSSFSRDRLHQTILLLIQIYEEAIIRAKG